MTIPENGRPVSSVEPATRFADIVVIGAGQAGLSAAFHLRRQGFVPAKDATDAAALGGALDRPASARPGSGPQPLSTPPLNYVVLDAESRPGGAWQHRWNSLRMATVNGIHDLPGIAKPEIDPNEPSSQMLPRYFASYEAQLELPVLRPVFVTAVRREDSDPHGQLLIETNSGTWSARAVINATGTWTKPFWPSYPGRFDFAGRQLHVVDYVSAEEFAGKHVVVVGGGISAVQLLEEISHVTTTSWFTRRQPQWRDDDFDSQAGHDAVARVEERVRLGLPPQSVVATTGLIWSPLLRAAAMRGVLDRHPMFSRIERDGVRLADGGFLEADVILWATGFRAALDHLAPLKLRSPGGGIIMSRTMVASEPRVHLIGYGPSASTIGANRAGRETANSLVALLGIDPAGSPTASPAQSERTPMPLLNS